jgi:hypothetical protein
MGASSGFFLRSAFRVVTAALVLLYHAALVTPSSAQAVDTDGDGTMDDQDACPTIPGVPTHNGCPLPGYAVVWRAEDGGNGHTYIIRAVANPGISWEQSKAAAECEGGHLATISSAEEQAFIEDVLLGTDTRSYFDSFQPWGYWLGAQNTGSGWAWVTGESFSYESWAQGEPSAAPTTPTFMGMFGRGAANWFGNPALRGGWDDVLPENAWLFLSYIVEIETTPTLADADGDGTPDCADLCPNQAGPSINRGCPVPALPSGRAVPSSSADLGRPGFIWRIHQVATGQPNTNQRAEDQLVGLLGDNIANPAAQGVAIAPGTPGISAVPGATRLPITFEIGTVINLNETGGQSLGNFPNDGQMPGIPGITGSLDNIAAETRAWIELPAGVITMGVNSDDGFQLDIAGVKVGEFNGGRGVADSIFHFEVTQPGLYPARLLWEEGGGGSAVEWFVVGPTGARVLVNDTANGGIRAFRGVTFPPNEDYDNDGVLNGADSCPEAAGLAGLSGCPDADNDGVADTDDACPLVAGVADFHGCPEQGSTDTTAPAIAALSFVPGTVDVTAGPAQVTVRLRLTDNLSGVSHGWVHLASPTFAQQIFSVPLTRTTGTPLDGTWEASAIIPQFAESGTWRISSTQIYDLVENGAFLQQFQLEALGLDPTFEVTSIQDTTPPSVQSVLINPSSIDTSSGEQVVTVTIHVTDALSGVGIAGRPGAQVFDINNNFQIYANIFEPGRYSYRFPSSQWERIPNPDGSAGTPNDGYWQAIFRFPQYSHAGTWTLQSTVKDNAGNSVFGLDGSDPDVMTEIEITSNPTDQDGPVVRSLTLSPISIDTSTSDRFVDGTVVVEDNLTGINYVGVNLISPSRGQRRTLFFFANPDPANPLTRTLTARVIFPRFSEAGTWRVEQVYAYDLVNNLWLRTIYDPAQPIPPALDVSLSVILPSLNIDGTVTPGGGGTISDLNHEGAQITIPPGAVTENTTVAIDVLQTPVDIPLPTGFSGTDTFYVNIHLEPEPNFPLAPPGLTVVLPLLRQMTPGIVLSLFRINEGTGALEPSLDVNGNPVQGTVNADGFSATFLGISRLSTVVALVPDPIISWNTPADIVYGTRLSSVQLNATADVAGTFSYTPSDGTPLRAGLGQVLTATFTPSDSSYRTVSKSVTINVLRKELTITADDKSAPEGTLPGLTVSYSGFIPGESVGNLEEEAVAFTTATAASGPGTYPIFVRGGVAANYDIHRVDGTLTVTPVPKPNLIPVTFSLISYKRITSVIWEYNYKMVVRNDGTGDAASAQAEMTTWPAQVTPIDRTVTFGNVPAGQQGTSQDTFTIRLDRTKPFQPADITWTFSY